MKKTIITFKGVRMKKKLIYIDTDILICPYCKEVPYLHPREYYCPTCRKSFGLVTLEEMKEKHKKEIKHV